MQATTFSSSICSYLSALAHEISQAPKPESSEQTLGYKDALLAIHEITLPLFEAIRDQAEKAGFQGVELFEAWPKGHCQNFVFAVWDPNSESVTDVILAKNKKWGFLQNGGGKTLGEEDSRVSAYREAQEEFSFNGTQDQMKYVTIESESGIPSFHFVKGVHIGFVSPEQAEALKLSDDMMKNEIVQMPIDEFLKTTEEDKKPVDHGFDRKWIAKYLEAYNKGKKPEFYSQRKITDADLELGGKADEWMRKVQVNPQEIALLKKTIVDFTSQLKIDGESDGKWKTSSNRDAVKKSAQGVVDALVGRLLPAWTYESKGKEKVACQVKVQAAQGMLVNGEPVPSFMTIPQVVARQEGLPLKKRKVSFEMVDFKQAFNGHGFDIQTKLIANPMTQIICLDSKATALSEQLLNAIEVDQLKPLSKVDGIIKTFEGYKVPYNTWGQSQRTRFEEQVQKGETVVYLLKGEHTNSGGPDPRVVRFSSVVALRVLHPDGKRELFEFKPDRETKELKIKTEAGKPVPGVSEKLLGSEDFVAAAIRGVKEELSHTIDCNRIQKDESTPDTLLFKPDERGFFVGLLVRKYILQLKAEDKVMKEYVEEGKHSTNHFLWR